MTPLWEHRGPGLHSGAISTARLYGDDVLAIGRRDQTARAGGATLTRSAVGRLATDVGPLRTVEHWLAAAVGIGVAVRIEVDGPELPATCGCSAFPSRVLYQHRDTLSPLPRWSPPVALRVERGLSWASWEPSTGGSQLQVEYTIEFPNSVIGQQTYAGVVDSRTFLDEVAEARTFAAAGTLDEIVQARRMGIGAGLSEGEGLVAGPEGWLSGEPRWPNEPARHKVLDLLGDLGLLGLRPSGRLVVHRGGHALHRALARAALPWLV